MNIKNELLKKVSKLSIAEAMETAKQRLTALVTLLKRYSRTVEARTINRIFSSNSSKVYSLWQGSEVSADSPRAETERFWNSILEEEANSGSGGSMSRTQQRPRTRPSSDHNGRHPRNGQNVELVSTRAQQDLCLLAEEANRTP